MKKIFFGLLAGCLLLSAGCSARENDTGSEATDEVSGEVTVNTHHETMPVPEDGWTAEKLNKVIYVNGRQISLPCTIAELGEGFEWAPENPQAYEENKTSSVLMNYNGSRFALVSVYAKDESELETAQIVGWSYYAPAACSMYINDITLDCSRNDIVSALGMPAKENVSDSVGSIYYELDSGRVCFAIENNAIKSIILRIDNENQ